MVCRGTITDLFDVTQWFSEMLFYSNMRFLKSGYSCHLLTIELISERGYEVKFPLLLFRLESREGEQNDGLNALLFKTEKATNPWVPQQRASGSEVTPKFLQCLHISVVLFLCYVCFPMQMLLLVRSCPVRTAGVGHSCTSLVSLRTLFKENGCVSGPESGNGSQAHDRISTYLEQGE